MSAPLQAGQGAIWVQPGGQGSIPRYLGCHEFGDITVPRGDVTLTYCPDETSRNKFKVSGSIQGAAGAVTTTLTTALYATADYLESLRCPVPFYLTSGACGRRDQFMQYARVFVLVGARITNEGLSQVSARSPENNNEAIQTFDLSADELIRIWAIVGARQTTTETEALNGIAFYGQQECGDCGAVQADCTTGIAWSDALAASATNTANVIATTDGGTTWTETSADPFAGGMDIIAGAVIQIGAASYRFLVANGTTQASAPAQIAYSDDAGVSWTSVNVGSTNAQYVPNVNSLFALDPYHIWLGTTGGYIYFSDDTGITWTAQASGSPITGNVNAIDFMDTMNGWAGGAANALAKTNDGGVTWTAVTGPAAEAGVDVNTLQVITQYVATVGYNDGTLWRTQDGGTTWTQISFTGSGVGAINSIRFTNNGQVGYMVRDTAAPVGYVLRSFDGGYSWEVLTGVTNSGLNHVHICGNNQAFAVGEVNSGTAVIVKYS